MWIINVNKLIIKKNNLAFKINLFSLNIITVYEEITRLLVKLIVPKLLCL